MRFFSLAVSYTKCYRTYPHDVVSGFVNGLRGIFRARLAYPTGDPIRGLAHSVVRGGRFGEEKDEEGGQEEGLSDEEDDGHHEGQGTQLAATPASRGLHDTGLSLCPARETANFTRT